VSFAAVNLNQLVALEALLSECHVGRAADRVGVTQSAMSHTLRSLREQLDDPLLVRVGNEMAPTPHAEALRPGLQAGLAQLERVVAARAGFEPSESTRTFSIAMQDGPAAGFSGPLFSALRKRAPRASLRVQPLDPNTIDKQLERGVVDLAFTSPLATKQGLVTLALAPAPYAVISREGHPIIKKRLSLHQYCKVPHAMLSITGQGPSFVDRLLQREGRSREVVFRVPYLMGLAEVVSSSDCIASLPEVVTEFLCSLWPLRQHAFPIPLDPMPGVLAWHPRFEAEPGNRFFRELAHEVAQGSLRDGKPSFEHATTRRRPGRSGRP
jgi:DNA-binding transcriptional LysR family regulator